MRVVGVCVSTYDNLFFFMNETLCYNAVGIEQDMAWTKIFGKLCVCKYICQSIFFMNETLCYNAVGSVDRGGSDELSFNSVLHKNYNS